jgi:hypothetical protein
MVAVVRFVWLRALREGTAATTRAGCIYMSWRRAIRPARERECVQRIRVNVIGLVKGLCKRDRVWVDEECGGSE